MKSMIMISTNTMITKMAIMLVMGLDQLINLIWEFWPNQTHTQSKTHFIQRNFAENSITFLIHFASENCINVTSFMAQ